MMTMKFGRKLDHAAADRCEDEMKKILYWSQTHDVKWKFVLCIWLILFWEDWFSHWAAPGEHISIWSAAPTGPSNADTTRTCKVLLLRGGGANHNTAVNKMQTQMQRYKATLSQHSMSLNLPAPAIHWTKHTHLWNKLWPRFEFRPHTHVHTRITSTFPMPVRHSAEHYTIQMWYETTKPLCRQNKCINGPMLCTFSHLKFLSCTPVEQLCMINYQQKKRKETLPIYRKQHI